MELNSMLFGAINGIAHHSILLDKIMIFMSEFAPDIFIIVLAVIYLMGLIKKNRKMRGVSVDTFVIIVLNLLLGYAIGAIWYVPRPFVNNKVNLLLPHTVDASFPSDHAIGTMGIAVGISKYSRKYGVLLTILSIIVGISRVYVGHHYPTDVLGGYVLIFLTSFLYYRLIGNRVQAVYFRFEKLLAKRFPIFSSYFFK